MRVRAILADHNTDISRVFHAARYSPNPHASNAAEAAIRLDAIEKSGGDVETAASALTDSMSAYTEWNRSNQS